MRGRAPEPAAGLRIDGWCVRNGGNGLIERDALPVARKERSLTMQGDAFTSDEIFSILRMDPGDLAQAIKRGELSPKPGCRGETFTRDELRRYMSRMKREDPVRYDRLISTTYHIGEIRT